MMRFYDTCSLMVYQEELFKNNSQILISSISLQELENIKSNKNKSPEAQYAARNVTRLLKEYNDLCEIVHYNDTMIKDLFVTNSNDKKIILSAIAWGKQHKNNKLQFITHDQNCYAIATEMFNALNKKHNELRFFTYLGLDDTKDETIYTGFHEVYFDENKMSSFYNDLYDGRYQHNLNVNEYLIIKDMNTKEAIDKMKFNGKSFDRVNFPMFNTTMFGKVKPKDEYQWCAMDSLLTNQITLLGGKPGSGKTLLSLAYLFNQLEKEVIEKIVIFCNPVGAKDAARLGFYPGTVLEKLLSTQAGNVLSSKIGTFTLEKLVERGKLDIIPAVDARGYEIPPYCGCYIMEAQNLTSDLLRMLLQRTSADTKIIIDGDRFEQTDMDIYKTNNGMKKVSEVFKGYSCYGQVDLQNIYRSEIANIAELMKG